MATKTWNGSAGDNNFGTAGNWIGGVAPVNGDSVIFNEAGTSNCTAGMATGLTLQNFIVFPGYTGTIGAAGSPIVFTGTAGYFVHFMGGGGGALYVQSTCPEIICDSDSTAATCLQVGGGATTVTTLTANKGRISVAASTTVTTANIGYRTSPTSDVTLAMATTVTATTCNVSGGVITAQSLPTTLRMSGGIWTQTNPQSGTLTTLELKGSSRYNWSQSGETITTLNLFDDAIFDATGLSGAGTITTATVYSATSQLLVACGRRITFTNGIKCNYTGIGKLRFDPGTILTVA